MVFLERSPEGPNVNKAENYWCASKCFRKARATGAEGVIVMN